MSDASDSPIVVTEGRFARLEAIEWWDQARLRAARVLVVGAGALGNEVLKNLALLGVGHVAVVDRDRVELSNLSRSVLFREEDEGRPKALCAARAAEALYPEMRVRPIVGNVLAEVGLGYFRAADVVIGALDNREARVFVNAACAAVGRPWIDGGIEVLTGIVRGFAPPKTACYECTMGRVDWDLLNQRRSCSLLARRALQQRGTPTTPTTASVIGGLQAQEAVKLLHRRESLLGRGFIFEGGGHTSYTVAYPIHPDCGRHEPPAPVEACRDLSSRATVGELLARGAELLRGLDALDLGRELVERLECPECGEGRTVLQPAELIGEDEVRCPSCGAECAPTFLHSLAPDSDLAGRTLAEIGLPPWDILWARRGEERVGLEIAGDCRSAEGS